VNRCGGDDELVRELYPQLRRFAAAVAPPDVEPDDLLQEALVRALRVGPLADLDDAGTYLRRAMAHIAANSRRSFGRRRRALARLTLSDVENATYPSDLTQLLELSPTLRAVLYLAEVEGWPSMLGCTELAARTRAARGRRQLRSILEAADA